MNPEDAQLFLTAGFRYSNSRGFCNLSNRNDLWTRNVEFVILKCEPEPPDLSLGVKVSTIRPSAFLVAGNRLLRESLAKLLVKRADFDVCGVFPYVPETVSSVAGSNPDVLILDSFTARLSDCALISEIVRRLPNIKVALIDMDDDPESFLECVRAGALGYMLKDASAAAVVSGIQAVAQGQAICPPQLCKHLFQAFSRHWTAVPTARIKVELGLTRRQQQLIPLIAQGLTNKEIASHLRISEFTVKSHLHDIMRRVGANDRLQVVDLAHFSGSLR
jgi:DNA-binding NarL/FixJ family response regulator